MVRKLCLFILMVIFLSFNIFASPQLTRVEKLEDFKQFVALLKKSYGMLAYKNKKFNISLKKLVAKYKPLVAQSSDDDAFYSILTAFCKEFKDAHFNFQRPSEQQAFLGFLCERAEGKLIISRVFTKLLPPDKFPFKPGDELIAIDGISAGDILKEVAKYVGGGRKESILNGAALYVTLRPGVFFNIPEGEVKVKVKSRKTGKVSEVTLEWLVKGRPLPRGVDASGNVVNPILRKWRPDIFMRPDYFKCEFFSNKYLKPVYATPRMIKSILARIKTTSKSVSTKKQEQIKVLQKEPFIALIIPAGKYKIGYVVLDTFMPTNSDGSMAIEKYFKLYKKIIKQMQETDGLIIDQRGNGGGALYYGWQIASLLIDKPIKDLTYSQRISRTMILKMRRWVRNAEAMGVPLEELKILQKKLKMIESAYAASKKYTPFHPMFFDGKVYPDPDVNYTRPILLLIDDQCYSMGDLFPSLLKDNKRAFLFGNTTAGAGGNVNSYGPLINSEATMTLTESVVKRVNGKFLEQLGVKPHLIYKKKVSDILDHGQSFLQKSVVLMVQLLQQAEKKKNSKKK